MQYKYYIIKYPEGNMIYRINDMQLIEYYNRSIQQWVNSSIDMEDFILAPLIRISESDVFLECI